MQRHRRVAVRRGRAGGRATAGVVAVLAALALCWLPAATCAAAAATGPAALPVPSVSATDLLVIWDGRRETVAVRWHLAAPVTRVDWLVATPGPARQVQVAAGTLSAVADGASPRDRWYVTHPWLLVDDDGDRARSHLAAPSRPDPAQPLSVRTAALPGRTAALQAAEAVDGAADDATRAWVTDALDRGWSLHRVTVTTGAPTTVVGPVALDFPASTPVVPSSPLPRAGRVTLLTVAPQVLATEQPDLAEAATGGGALTSAESSEQSSAQSSAASSGAASAGLATAGGDDADAALLAPTFTVENARTLRTSPAELAGRTSPSGVWVATLLSGAPGVAPVLLLPQDGPTSDWRTQVGVWWPGWGPAAVAALVALAVVGLATVATRRRNRRPASAAGPGQDPDALVATRPDIRPVP